MSITVAYNAHEVEYIWKKPADSAVDYEGKLQLSQFDIKQTEFRGLNFSRGNNMGTYSVIYSIYIRNPNPKYENGF